MRKPESHLVVKYRCKKNLVMKVGSGEPCAVAGKIYEVRRIQKGLWNFINEQGDLHFMCKKDMDEFFVGEPICVDKKEGARLVDGRMSRGVETATTTTQTGN